MTLTDATFVSVDDERDKYQARTFPVQTSLNGGPPKGLNDCRREVIPAVPKASWCDATRYRNTREAEFLHPYSQLLTPLVQFCISPSIHKNRRVQIEKRGLRTA